MVLQYYCGEMTDTQAIPVKRACGGMPDGVVSEIKEWELQMKVIGDSNR